MSGKLYVGNLSFKTTETELREFFESQGVAVSSVAIITDRETGRPRGFGFVEVDAPDAAIEKLNGVELGGRSLKINAAENKPPRSGGGGGGGDRGGYRGGGGGGGGDRGSRSPRY